MVKQQKLPKTGMNRKLKDVTAAQVEWDEQRIWFYTKAKNKRDFVAKVRHSFDIYMVYSAISTGYHSTAEVYTTVLSMYGAKLDRRVICRIVRNGFDAQHLFKRNWQYRLTPPGARGLRLMKNILKRLDKEKDGFDYKSLFDIIS